MFFKLLKKYSCTLSAVLMVFTFGLALTIAVTRAKAVDSSSHGRAVGFDANEPYSGMNSHWYDGKREVEPDDFGDGIARYGDDLYYFASTGARYGNTLATFLKKHPEYDNVSATPHFKTFNRGFATENQECVGYFVFFHRQAKD